MSHQIRSVLILAITMAIAVAYSPASFADKKDNSSSATSDDNKDKDKDKTKEDQNNKRRGRDRQKNEEKVSNAVQQLQKSQQNGSNKQSSSDNQQNKTDKQSNSSDKQGSSKNSQPVIINNGQQNNAIQKTPQFQNIPKQQVPNNQKPNNFPPNLQQQTSKDKWQDKNDKDKWQDKNNKDKWQNHSHKDHKELHKWVDNFGGPKPFSSKWYKDHPKAWHHNHHDHNDKWKVATAAALGGFLGWQAYHSQGPVVVYQPVGYDTLFVNRPNVVIDPNRGEWMPLGVYSLMVGPGDESTRMLDLVVDRFGHIRGSYYDMISDASYNVAGIIDPRTQYAQWSLESNRQLTFYTPVGEMVQPQGYVNVQLPSGQRQQWQLVRMEEAGY